MILDDMTRLLTEEEVNYIKDCCQQSVAVGLPSPCIEPGQVLSLIHELQQQREILGPIAKLTAHQGATVMLFGDDPRLQKKYAMNRKDCSVVQVMNEETAWKPVKVRGESTTEALNKAVAMFGIKSVVG